MLDPSNQSYRLQIQCPIRCRSFETTSFFKMVAINFALLITALLFLVNVAPAAQTASVTSDDSDWWSTLVRFNHLDLSAPKTNTQNRAPASRNFEIAGVVTGGNQIQKLTSEIGKANVVQRGDAASSRSQVCYLSRDNSHEVHLIFEEAGEGDSYSFYLFEDGPHWNGSDLCIVSPRVSASLKTGSGLHLGQPISQVKSILGEPSTVLRDKFVYVYEVKRRSTTTDLERARTAHPNISDKELHESFDFYYFIAYIEARFADSKLTYLAVTKSETYP
jgi:hypothetical protein